MIKTNNELASNNLKRTIFTKKMIGSMSSVNRIILLKNSGTKNYMASNRCVKLNIY